MGKARQQASLRFAAAQLKIAEKESNDKFGKAFMRLAKNRAHFDQKLGASTTGLNDALAKQAALSDSRFAKTVKDLNAARAQATAQVRQLRKDFATQMVAVTAQVKSVETRLVGEIAVVSGEVISNRANQMRVNRRVTGELKRVVRVSDRRFSASKRARGKLKLLMDENKAAASAEVKALSVSLKHKLQKARARNARNAREMAKDLTKATEGLYERMSNMQKRNAANAAALAASTKASAVASANALKRAQGQFASKITMLTNVVAANAKRAKRNLQRVTGVVQSIAKANAADRKLSAHLKKSKRFLQTELSEGIDRAADNVFKIVQEKRQKSADSFLSLKAYAVSSADKVIDYRKKGK